MNRHYRTINLGENQRRHIVVIESDPCIEGSADARRVVFDMMRDFSQNHSLLACGPLLFSTLNIEHDGERWIVTGEAISDNSD